MGLKPITDILKKDFANPFGQSFNIRTVFDNLHNYLPEDKNNIIEYLMICHQIYIDISSKIYSEFEDLGLPLDKLRELFFVAINKSYIDYSHVIINQIQKSGIAYETASLKFTKIKNNSGVELDAGASLEYGADILTEFLIFTNSWNYKDIDFKQKTIKYEKYFPHISYIFSLCNMVKNIKDTHKIILYENGSIILYDDEIKIQSELPSLDYIKTAGDTRCTSNVHELYIKTLKNSPQTRPKKRYFEISTINKNTIHYKIKTGELDPQIELISIACLNLFYPEILNESLSYFNGLSLFNLSELLMFVENSFVVMKKNLNEAEKYSREKIPTRILETNLIDELVRVTGNHRNVVEKFINSLCCDKHKNYFWGSPFYRMNQYLYFPFIALSSPNQCLFIDKWIRLSSISLKEREKKFKEFVINEIKTRYIEYKFEIFDFKESEQENYYNNIIVKTASQYIFIEIKLFEYPIDHKEYDEILIDLGKATYDINTKTDELTGELEIDKNRFRIEKLILTSLPNLSGLILNEIPIADLTLFRNYIYTGQFIRGKLIFDKGVPIEEATASITYYKTEEDFNKNFKLFFENPTPVHQILQKLYLKEQTVTPKSFFPKFTINVIDFLNTDEIISDQIKDLSKNLSIEYYDDKINIDKKGFEELISFSLSEIFNKLAFSPDKSYNNRISIYNTISNNKLLGFSHLTMFLFKSAESLNFKIIKKKHNFEKIEFTDDEINDLLKRISNKLKGQIRFSEFKIEDTIFNDLESKKIISYSIYLLSGLTIGTLDDKLLDFFLLPLTLLFGFSTSYEVENEFYSACYNLIDAYNYIHKYQKARDFSEEILIISINKSTPYFGWNALFKCYNNQKNIYETAINGCLFFTSFSMLSELPYLIFIDSLHGILKYCRNFGFFEYSKDIFEAIKKNIEIEEYDKQKLTLSYFHSILEYGVHIDVDNIYEIFKYLDQETEQIIPFQSNGIVPWLVLLYNIEKLKNAGFIQFHKDIESYIKRFEESLDAEILQRVQNVFIGDSLTNKNSFINAILNIYETRDVSDFIYETQNMSLLTSNLLKSSIGNIDFDGLLLTGLTLNDQSILFENILLDNKSHVGSISKPINEKLKSKLINYQDYLLKNLTLTQKQLFVWLFEDFGKVYAISISHKKNLILHTLKDWNLNKMRDWISEKSKFYFNSKIGRYNNPRKEENYDLNIQADDYNKLKIDLSFSGLHLAQDFDEFIISMSITLSNFPFNLIQNKGDFIAKSKPICNALTIERFIEFSSVIYLRSNYSISAWIPTDNKEPLISWGYSLLEPILKKINAEIYTSTYPTKNIMTDVNVFLAHGALDVFGFKAVYTNSIEGHAITSPLLVFGKGTIAILFICHSGTSSDAFFSNNIESFAAELLKTGYKAVIAPFWAYDVTMSKIWLEEFLYVFNNGFSVNESVYFANDKVAKYDSATSNIYFAPAGSLAMHLYGNPNIYASSLPV